jgi:hypothetical protein
LKPEAVEYLIRKQEDEEKGKLIPLNKVLWGLDDQEKGSKEDEFLDSENPDTRRSNASLPQDGGDFWEDIETRIHLKHPPRDTRVTKENMSVTITRPGDPNNLNAIREGYEHDRALLQDQ